MPIQEDLTACILALEGAARFFNVKMLHYITNQMVILF